MVDVEFMFSDPIGGSGGMPLEEGFGSKGVVLWLDVQGKCVVCCR